MVFNPKMYSRVSLSSSFSFFFLQETIKVFLVLRVYFYQTVGKEKKKNIAEKTNSDNKYNEVTNLRKSFQSFYSIALQANVMAPYDGN